MKLRIFRDLPIARKLTLLAMAPCVLALVIACVAIASYEMIVFRHSMVDALTSTADSTSYSSSAALAFGDKAGATRVLGSLKAHRHVVAAVLYDDMGNVFAQYQRAGLQGKFVPPPVSPDGYRFVSDRMDLYRSVSFDNEHLGTLYVQSDLDEMYARLYRYLVIAVVVVIAASLVALLLARGLQTLISVPVSQLTHVVALVSGERDYSVRAVKYGNDELGRLATAFNEMLEQIQLRDARLKEANDQLKGANDHLEARVHARTEQLQAEIVTREQAQFELERVHKQLMAASRQAGMTEVATSVLHNVGNVLNSVNVTANLLATHVQEFGVRRLARVVALLKEHEKDITEFLTTDPRGQHVPALLGSLLEHFEQKEHTIVEELQSLRKHVDHISDIVSMQQSYAKLAGVKEIVRVTDLVEDSLRMNAGALVRHGVELKRDFSADPRVNLDKHKVLQILVNLVRNAKYACDESREPDRQMAVSVTEEQGRVKITVTDNGVGIPQENLTRIFNHGFTTRSGGHGFGLHSGALSATELGGSLTARSDGPGKGAEFTLELPVYSDEAASGNPLASDPGGREVAHA